MARLIYKQKRFGAEALNTIRIANNICAEYAAAGYDLTLRQLYYQFVARGYIANKQSEYKRLGDIINDARMAGLLDWNYLVDRTRNIEKRGQWAHPRDIIETAAKTFHTDWWKDQPVHVEVWVEKEALAGVVENTCWGYDVTSLACRGYMSQSEQWAASQRFLGFIREGKRVVIVHLGDHDPSGVDMSRDNEERIQLFLAHDLLREWAPGDGQSHTYREIFEWAKNKYDLPSREPLFELRRIALNMDQIEQYNPPPNPAKLTDSRATKYIDEHGDESWELDALPPDVLDQLIVDELSTLMDPDLFEDAKIREAQYRQRISDLLARHGDVLDEIDNIELEEDDDDRES